jgi:pectate lyase
MRLPLCRTSAVIAAAVLAVGWAPPAHAAAPDSEGQPYLDAARAFADTVIEHGRDTYGQQKTPLLVDGLHAETLRPALWKCRGETWVLSNFASQQPLVRLLDGLTELTGDEKYAQAAEDAARYALKHVVAPNGLLYWGGHMAWDLDGEKPVGQYPDAHEMKGHQPYYRLMHRVDPAATRRLMETVWGSHILDWSRLDYNRHGSVKKPRPAQWDHAFDEQIEVPFPAVGGNLSFCNVTPPLTHAGVMLALLEDHDDALAWTRRLLYRWQQGRHPKTGLCGGQLSYREHDRAQDALGHVHPTINEAKMVAGYHQRSRYHHLPLVQMQAAEALIEAGGKHAAVGRELLDWASDDLEVYARQCYDDQSGKFVGRMFDGTALRWREAKSDYYVPSSFAPRSPDGTLVWAYAMAYRLTGDEKHAEMARKLTDQLSKAGNLADCRLIYAQLELHQATGDPGALRQACGVADRLLEMQAESGLFPRPKREYARTGDEVPLALLHLAAAIEGRRELLPRAMFDSRFFHCEFHGELEEYQKKRADKRTYDNSVYYGS